MFSKIKDAFLKDVILPVKDIRSMIHLDQLYKGYLPWSGASVSPTALRYILNDIMINDRRTIVECGAGISTIYIASLLKQIGDNRKKVYSIDHDDNWLSILQNELESHSLSEYVTLIHAPLRHCDFCLSKNLKWYDTTVVDDCITDKKIDLLFVDGPPANKSGIEKSRFPALPFFKDKLMQDYLIVLDDADRKGENLIAKKWGLEIDRPFQ